MRTYSALILVCLLGIFSTVRSADTEAGEDDVFSIKKIVEVMRKVRDYQLAHPWKETDRNWIRATYYTGVMGLYRTTEDPEILAQARRWAQKHDWAEGDERERANKKTCGQTYLELYFIDPESANIDHVRAYVDSRIEKIEAGEPPTKGWYYSDTLYVGPPTIAMLGKATGQQTYYDYLNKVYWGVTDHLFDKEYGLYYRDKSYFNAKTENGKKVFWSRGNGWVIGGIPRVLQYLPRDNDRYDDYVKLLQTMAAAIAKQQGDDGLWRANLDDPDQHPNPETSGSAFFCYAFAWGINNGVLDRDKYVPVTMKAWEGLVRHVHPDGKLGFVQPVGASPKPATCDMTHEYAMGLFLLAGEEMAKLIESGIITASTVKSDASDEAPRRVISLNGSWQIAAGSPDQQPAHFDRAIPVPGVVDMATPPFENVGRNTRFADDGGHKFVMVPDPHYRAFWYRRTFSVDGEVPTVAVLKLAKAKFGTRVWLNGQHVGEHWPCYTPGYFDLRKHLRGNGQSNELIVCVGADPLTVGDRAANGFDFEKHSYLAGIYDDVTLTLTGSPSIVNVQVVPEVDASTVRVVAELRNVGDQAVITDVAFEVRPYRKSQVMGQVKLPDVRLEPGQTRSVEARVLIRDCQLWTPETPNLYHLVTRTCADALPTRFGMRRFQFDPKTAIGVLNGKPYFMRGSNVCYFRFEEDPLRADKPWDEQWVRTLHRRFKSLHMNSLRYCIGFPPEMWYRIADEEGIIIQDEFPIWTLGEDAMTPVSAGALADEYRDWMREHWNHACVLIWDAQNECRFDKTREAIVLVRHLDLSNRPWDNGWGRPQQPADIIEDHPYQYSRSMAAVHWNPEIKPLPTLESVVDRYSKLGPDGPRPRIVNEYAWLWLRRDGQPTTLTRAGYAAYLPDADVDGRREFYARCLNAMTEALRSSRRVAGVLYFCGLGHSWDGCATSDNFIDLDRLTFEPHFLEHMQYVFAPVGVMLRIPDTCQVGQKVKARVVVFNDLDSAWSGDVTLTLPDGKTATVPNVKVAAYDRAEVTLPVTAPYQPGRHEFCAKILGARTKPVLSRRLVTVEGDPNR